MKNILFRKFSVICTVGITLLYGCGKPAVECPECRQDDKKVITILVKSTDTWKSISEKYNVSQDKLKKINRCMDGPFADNDVIFIPGHHIPENEHPDFMKFRQLLDRRGDNHFRKGYALYSEKNYSAAVKFFSDAADCGDLNAHYMLGKCYEDGLGVEKDISKAVEHYRAVGDVSYLNQENNAFPNKAFENLNKYKIANAQSLNDVKFIFTPATDNSKCKMEFVRNGKVLFSLTPKVGNLCFMQEISSNKRADKMRVSFDSDSHKKNDFDFRTMLLDLHGNGDFRYLMIADYHTGNSPHGHLVHIIDAKKDFTFVAEISGGEIMDFPYTRDELIFYKEILYLGYFGVEGSSEIYLPMKYAAGKNPEITLKREKMTDEQIGALIKKLKERKDTSGYESMAITLLYEYLIENGNFKMAKELALKLGYTQAYIDKYHAEIIKQIKESKYRYIIGKLNNIDFSKL